MPVAAEDKAAMTQAIKPEQNANARLVTPISLRQMVYSTARFFASVSASMDSNAPVDKKTGTA